MRHIVETGRVIHRRYLLQRLLKQGQVCAVYQGVDQVLQRAVAVKVVPDSSIPEYKAAVQLTSSFSHPNIVGLYDLLLEPESLYIVQEFVEGDDFTALLQLQLSPYDVADIGRQICQALLYAGSSSRRVSHGDLTPSAVTRDASGLVRINNFALPSDFRYFESWSRLGGDGLALSDAGLPWGQQSEGRTADDTRAVGLLLYQLLAGRPPGMLVVEPPADGVLRFQRNTPRELCETVARAVARQHPQYISTVERLYTELKTLVETLEPAAQAPVVVSSASNEAAGFQQFSSAGAGRISSPLPARDMGNPVQNYPGYRPEQAIILPASEVAPAAPTVADIPVKLVQARKAAYAEPMAEGKRRPPILLILLLGLVLFALFFVIGYYAGLFIIP